LIKKSDAHFFRANKVEGLLCVEIGVKGINGGEIDVNRMRRGCYIEIEVDYCRGGVVHSPHVEIEVNGDKGGSVSKSRSTG